MTTTWPLTSNGPHAYRELDFDYGPARFHCLVSASLYEEQRAHLRHYLAEAPAPVAVLARHHVRITRDDAMYHGALGLGAPDRQCTAFGTDSYDVWERGSGVLHRPRAPLSSWLLDDHVFAIDGDRTDIVTHSGTARPAAYLMYVVREVLIRLLEEQGGAQFHAAAVAGAEGVALIVGAKTAGKTSTMTALVTAGATDLVANDRSIVVEDKVVGVPLALRVGYGLAANTAALGAYLDAGGLFRPQMRTTHDTESPEEFGSRVKHVLTPREFADAMNTGLRAGGPLRLVLLPSISRDERGFWAERVAPGDAAESLREACYTLDDPAYRQPRFRQRGVHPDHLREQARASCARIATDWPVLRVGWGVRAPAEQTRAALRELCQRHGVVVSR